MSCFAFQIKHSMGDFIGIVSAESNSQARAIAQRAWGENCIVSELDAMTLANLTRRGGLPVFTTSE